MDSMIRLESRQNPGNFEFDLHPCFPDAHAKQRTREPEMVLVALNALSPTNKGRGEKDE
jgi:hypothetical protein